MASDFLMCACLADMCFSSNTMSMKSDVRFWNFILVDWNCQVLCFWGSSKVAVRYCLGQQGGWCQMGVSEASCVDEVRGLFLKLHRWFVPSDVCFWGGPFVAFDSSGIVWGKSPLALISQRVCHNCLVPGFTDGAGCLFCDDVVKTENLDWIFLLDVSLLLRLACGRLNIVEYVR